MNAHISDKTVQLKPSSDRRRSERKGNVSKAQIASPTATDPDDRLTVTGVNISRHGICFSVPTAIAEGSFYRIDVMMGTQLMNAEIQIVTCRKNAECYDIGAEFC